MFDHTLSQFRIRLQLLLFLVIIIICVESSGAGRVAKLLQKNQDLLKYVCQRVSHDDCQPEN